jgi:hypothetical protein
VDDRIIGEVRARGGSIIDTVKKAGGWPILPTSFRPFVIPHDPNGDEDGDGYTNIEEVLHRMAREVERGVPPEEERLEKRASI